MRHLSRGRKETREAVKLVRPFEKRVSGKLSDPFGKDLPKKKTALSGLPKHASCEIEKSAATEIIRTSVLASLKATENRFQHSPGLDGHGH